MNLLHGLICLEGPVDRFPPRITAHQTSTSLEAIMRPGSGSPLQCRQGLRCRRPGVTTVRHSARPKRRITPRHAAEGTPSSRSSHPPRAVSSIEATGDGAGRGGEIFRSFSLGREQSS
ncbi:hypothetical protein NDU88_001513 [Pleurodeles waltl]|uniref:Uncharacterized protein n=1 Tax=Pleurodeles waltl TaxID=8319 RepID=A0AAV7U8B2_PLEWA|nr:hypothetical protein NDU88_001513 [Pleurodeles waltl]